MNWLKSLFSSGTSGQSSDFSRSEVRRVEGRKVLLIAFSGRAANDPEHSAIYPRMKEAIVRALEAEPCEGIILDLRDLDYTSGDAMGETICTAQEWANRAFPTAVITSASNRSGLTTLIEDELFADPKLWLAEDEASAYDLLADRWHEASLTTDVATQASTPSDQQWQAVYSARAAFYSKTFGPMPNDILKMLDMFGIWPGGGLIEIHSDKLTQSCWVYSTFGLTNFDMPTGVMSTETTLMSEGDLATSASLTLQAKDPAPQPNGAPGYGYEMLVITHERAEWPINLLQWVVHAEINNDAGLLALTERHHGLTVESVSVDLDEPIHILITKAAPPLPASTPLPNGQMQFLVATVITADEMQWAHTHGRTALLDQLHQAAIGQTSILTRPSVVA